MSGGTKQTQEQKTTPIVPDDILNVYRQRTAMVAGGQPQFQELINAGLSGDASKAQPYIRGNFAPYAQAEEGAIKQIQRTTPRGGAQDIAIANMLQQGAMQKGQMTQQLMQKLLDYYATIAGGYHPEAEIAQQQRGSARTREPFMLKLGDFGSVPIG